ncbi:MAG: hypothetical protein ABWX56_04745 [Mycetocola sp.]
MTTSDAMPNLSVDQLADLHTLLEGSKTVELKVTVADRNQRSAVQALEMDPLDAEIRQVTYFDTPDLQLNKLGLIVRARRTPVRDDTVIKLRPVVPQDLPADLRGRKGLGIEVDAMPGSFVCSASLPERKKRGKVKEVLAGERAIRSLFTKDQKAFFDEYAPDGITLDDLAMLGPITTLKLKFSPRDYPGRLVAELWMYPDGSRILELSTKCAPADAFEEAARTRAFLQERGIDLTGEQQAKTRTALTFFSKELLS